MTPGDELRLVRAHKRCEAAGRMLRRSMHFGAAAALCGFVAGWLIVWRGDLEGAWMLIVTAFALNFASARANRRARDML